MPLIIAYRNGAAVQLTDVAAVNNSVEDVRNLGLSNGQPSVLVILFRQPGGNIIDTIDGVKAELPTSAGGDAGATSTCRIAIDRSTTIRSSLHDTETTLVIAVILVTMVVFLFLRDIRATADPERRGAGFDPRHVRRDVSAGLQPRYPFADGADHRDRLRRRRRHRRAGKHLPSSRGRACRAWRRRLRGAREVGFTVLSISLSLVAVFTPILLLGGILGRLFREFTLTLSLAILISLAISLTTTPMMCALFPAPAAAPSKRSAAAGSSTGCSHGYERTLGWALDHSRLVFVIFLRCNRAQCAPDLPHSEGLLSAGRHRAPGRIAAGRSERLIPG